MEKILTIVIPTYNMQDYLRRCLDSLIVQGEQMKQLEVLVINDGSKDESSAIAQGYQDKYPDTFRVIDKENGNYGSCVNRGLKEATGKYFRILDADDWFDTNELHKFLIYLSKPLVSDVVLTNYVVVKAKNRSSNVKPKSLKYNVEYDIDGLSLKDDAEILRMHSMTFRTELLKRIDLQLQTGISYTDIEYCYFPFKNAKTIIALDVNLYHYWIARDGQTMTPRVIVNKFSDFYSVTYRIVQDYSNSCNQLSNRKKEALVKILRNPLYFLYLINIVLLKNVPMVQEHKLHEVTAVCAKSKLISKEINSFTYKKIPFVKLNEMLKFKLSLVFGIR